MIRSRPDGEPIHFTFDLPGSDLSVAAIHESVREFGVDGVSRYVPRVEGPKRLYVTFVGRVPPLSVLKQIVRRVRGR